VLKRGASAVDATDVKVCPSCEAEVRDSVIRCTSCGTSFRGAPTEDVRPRTAMDSGQLRQQRPEPARAATAIAAAPAPAAASPTTAAAPTPSPGRKPASPTASAWATSTTTKIWHGTPTRTNGPAAHLAPDLRSRRALPEKSRRSNRPDPVLLFAAVVTGGAAYLAWGAIAQRWMQITIANAQDDVVARFGTGTFRASDAMVGTLAEMVVATLAVLAVLWLFFGLQRGWTMPWFTTPVIGIGAALAGIGGTVVSSVLWFGWRDAVFNVASRYGETRQGLEAFLEDPDNKPIITMHRLAGPQRFGEMLVLALLASCAAWWAYRRRVA
jgi:hypothetical protein